MDADNWKDDVLKFTGGYVKHDKDMNSLRLLLLKNKPSCLYRYRSGNNFDLDALRKGYEWLSYPDDYNDPFDARMFYDSEKTILPALNKHFNKSLDPQSKAMIEVLTGNKELDIYGGRPDKQVLEKARKLHGLRFSSMEKLCEDFAAHCKDRTDNLVSRMDKKIRNMSLMCSFTTHHSNHLMWAHYANSYKGFCLEYNFSKFLLNDGLILPVSYSKSPLDVTYLLIRAGLEVKGAMHRAAIGSALVKGTAWEYEDEWRYISYSKKTTRELNGLQLNKVLLGCNASDELTNKVVEICKSRGVEVVKKKRSSISFDLVDGERLA